MTTRAISGRVVCGLDDSPHAAAVLQMAAELAGRLDLWLTVVHSHSPDVFTTGERRQEVLRRGEAFIAAMAADHDIDETIIQPGDPADLLLACLRSGASMAVVGSRGRGPATAALLGSVSAGMARHAPCPVVVVPPDAVAPGLGAQPAIVCGLDGSDAAAQAFEWASHLAWSIGGRLMAAHVRKEPPESVEDGGGALAQVEREVARLTRPLETSMHIETGDPAKELDRLAQSHHGNLIVVGTRGRTPMRAALTGSVSARLAANARTAIVVVPENARLGKARIPMSVHAAA